MLAAATNLALQLVDAGHGAVAHAAHLLPGRIGLASRGLDRLALLDLLGQREGLVDPLGVEIGLEDQAGESGEPGSKEAELGVSSDRSTRICLDHGWRVGQGGEPSQRRLFVGKRSGTETVVEIVLAFLAQSTWTQASLARRVGGSAGEIP